MPIVGDLAYGRGYSAHCSSLGHVKAADTAACNMLGRVKAANIIKCVWNFFQLADTVSYSIWSLCRAVCQIP